MIELYIETVIIILMVVTGIAALQVKDLLASIVMFSAFSFFAVLIYFTLGAPDVAFTEAVVGAAATIFFIVALNRLHRRCEEK